MYIYIYVNEWRTKLLITRNGHGQSGWSRIGCEGFHANLNIPTPIPILVQSSANFVGYSCLIAKVYLKEI